MDDIFSDPSKMALMIVDMQNDFLHPDGAYARAGAAAPAIASLPERLTGVAKAARDAGAWTVATQFTLVPGKHGAPMISDHLIQLRPFLTKGDFAPGSVGQDVIDELQPVDFKVEKVAFSAFYQSRLEFVLKKSGIERLIFCGIVTNGGVASTLRHAHVLDFETVLLSDGCAAFDPEVHEASVRSLATVSKVMTCAEFSDRMETI